MSDARKTKQTRIPGYKLSIGGYVDVPLTNTKAYQDLQLAVAKAEEMLRGAGFNLVDVEFYPDRRQAS